MAIPPIDIPKTFLAPKISDKQPPMKKINIIDTHTVFPSQWRGDHLPFLTEQCQCFSGALVRLLFYAR